MESSGAAPTSRASSAGASARRGADRRHRRSRLRGSARARTGRSTPTAPRPRAPACCPSRRAQCRRGAGSAAPGENRPVPEAPASSTGGAMKRSPSAEHHVELHFTAVTTGVAGHVGSRAAWSTGASCRPAVLIVVVHCWRPAQSRGRANAEHQGALRRSKRCWVPPSFLGAVATVKVVGLTASSAPLNATSNARTPELAVRAGESRREEALLRSRRRAETWASPFRRAARRDVVVISSALAGTGSS